MKLFALIGDIIRSGKITGCPAVTLEMLEAFAIAAIQHAYVICKLFYSSLLICIHAPYEVNDEAQNFISLDS